MKVTAKMKRLIGLFLYTIFVLLISREIFHIPPEEVSQTFNSDNNVAPRRMALSKVLAKLNLLITYCPFIWKTANIVQISISLAKEL